MLSDAGFWFVVVILSISTVFLSFGMGYTSYILTRQRVKWMHLIEWTEAFSIAGLIIVNAVIILTTLKSFLVFAVWAVIIFTTLALGGLLATRVLKASTPSA